MNTKNAVKALVYFYFSTEVLKYLHNKGEVIGDVMGVGEDVFLLELYPYSNLIHKRIAENDLDVGGIIDLFSDFSECFWGIVERDTSAENFGVMPDKDEFELDVNRLIDNSF